MMRRHLSHSIRVAIVVAVQALVAQPFAVHAAHAQSAREERATGPQDFVAFALDNYFYNIPLDENRRRQVDTVVREHYKASQLLKTREERNASLPKRREKLRALLKTDAERQQFDRNVKNRKLP